MSAKPNSSINHIPLELLGEIFSYASEDHTDAPLTLLQVSRTFRHVTKTTPQLWTHLFLDVTTSTDVQCVQKAELWFTRAGVRHMDVHLQILPQPQSGRRAHDFQCDQWPYSLKLPQFLRTCIKRIGNLNIESAIPLQIQTLLSAIYPSTADEEGANQERPLRSLTLFAPSDRLFPFRSNASSAFDLPLLPHLNHLRTVDHNLLQLSSQNARNLRSLSITCAIRFPPIHLQTLYHILRLTTCLEVLEVEGRTADGIVSTAVKFNPAESENNDHQHGLVRLSRLSRLVLRINNIPALLSHLYLPNLHTLKIDDIDGRRPQSAQETSDVLRQFLVRMELPWEGRRCNGLRVLELAGVGIKPRRSTSGHHGSGINGSVGGGSTGDDGNTAWEWCFRRMKTVEELKVTKVHSTMSFLNLITPKDPRPWKEIALGQIHDSTSSEEAVLPQLRCLSVVEGSATFSAAIIQFRLRRPEVIVKFDVVPNSLVASETLDYLSSYSSGSEAGSRFARPPQKARGPVITSSI